MRRNPARRLPACARAIVAASLLVLAAATRASAQGAPQSVVLSGAVISTVDRAPVAGVLVEAIGATKVSRTDSKGRFKIAGLPRITTRIQLRRIGYAPMLIEVYLADGANDLVIAMEPVGQILDVVRTEVQQTGVFGVVTDFAGHVLPGSEIVPTVHRSGKLLTNEQGQFAIEDVKPGPELITVSKAGFKPRLVSFTIPATGGKQLQILMHPLPSGADLAGDHRISNAMWTEMFDIGQRIRWQSHNAGSVARDELDQYGRGLTLADAILRMPSMNRRVIRPSSVGCVFVDGIFQAGAELGNFSADEVELVQIVPPGGDFSAGTTKNTGQIPFCGDDAFTTVAQAPPDVPLIITRDPNTGAPLQPPGAPQLRSGFSNSGLSNPERVIAYIWLRH